MSKNVISLLFLIFLPFVILAQEEDEYEESKTEYQFLLGSGWGKTSLQTYNPYSEDALTNGISLGNFGNTKIPLIQALEYYNLNQYKAPHPARTYNTRISLKGGNKSEFVTFGLSINYTAVQVKGFKKVEPISFNRMGLLYYTLTSPNSTIFTVPNSNTTGLYDSFLGNNLLLQYYFVKKAMEEKSKFLHAGSLTWDVYFQSNTDDFGMYTRFSFGLFGTIRAIIALLGSSTSGLITSRELAIIDSTGASMGFKYRIPDGSCLMIEVYGGYFFNSSFGVGVWDSGGRFGISSQL